VAVRARPGLGEVRGAVGRVLVGEHVGVAPVPAVVGGERVPGEQDAEAGVVVELRRRPLARAGGEAVGIVLAGEEVPPRGRVGGLRAVWRGRGGSRPAS
jgi:hypothetical protein